MARKSLGNLPPPPAPPSTITAGAAAAGAAAAVSDGEFDLIRGESVAPALWWFFG